jgi:hypothetical protein
MESVNPNATSYLHIIRHIGKATIPINLCIKNTRRTKKHGNAKANDLKLIEPRKLYLNRKEMPIIRMMANSKMKINQKREQIELET